MLRLLAWLFWIAVAVVLVTVGLANRGLVTLRAMPETLANLVGTSPDVQLPLFLVIILSVAAGLLIGFVWEWIREWPQRAEVRRKTQAVAALKGEVQRLKSEQVKDGDEILALIETGSTGRR